ncbi:MAG: tetratricopeptide repeat protein [Magnetococcales bacterium]|nr:tetratricopeptide repeat protein [Magnetococcales bacterium]
MDISTKQNSYQVIFNEAIELHRAGQLDSAITKYKIIVATQPDNIDATYHLGLALHTQNKLDEAITCYQKVVTNNNISAEVYYNLAAALKALGKLENAIDNWQKAIAVDPSLANAHFHIANAHKAQGKPELAIASFQQAIAINPNFISAYCNLGITLTELKRADEGVVALQKAITIKPDFAEAHSNLGYTLIEQNKFAEAVASLQKAIEIKPGLSQAYFNLGNALKGLGELEPAITNFKKAVAINPNYFEAYNGLGLAFRDMGNNADAVLNFHKAIDIKPDFINPYYFLGYILKEQGKIDKAVATYKKAINIKADVGLEITLALTQSPIPPSINAILDFRQNLQQEIKRLIKIESTISDPYLSVGITNFYTAYHALNDITLQKQLASLYLTAYPILKWSANTNLETAAIATHTSLTAEPTPTRKLKIGIISTHLFNHTIGSLFFGIIEHLNRDRFEVIIFRPQGKQDDFSRRIDLAADKVIHIKKDILKAREVIAGQNVAVLFYPDIGMCPFTYFLAFHRLAPVQCTTLGHPVTTGIPNMDYFISSKNLEIANAQEHYSEQLYLMDELPCYYLKPKAYPNKVVRSDYNLPINGNIYLCSQSLFKIHPDFDETIMEILAKDPTGWLLLIEGGDKNLTTLLKKRWSKLAVNKTEQIIFLPRMKEEKFTALFSLADVVLDTFHFSGGKTTSEAIALGAPVVTLPGSFLRGRISFACYKQIGVLDLVAHTPKHYVELAHRIANDPIWRSEIIAKIKAKSHLLIENINSVTEFEKFFEYALDKCKFKG